MEGVHPEGSGCDPRSRSSEVVERDHLWLQDVWMLLDKRQHVYLEVFLRVLQILLQAAPSTLSATTLHMLHTMSEQ